MAKEKSIGKISHYYTNIGVAVVDLSGALQVGDVIHIQGHSTDFTQKVESIQIDHKNVEKAGKGKSIGLKVDDRAREDDVVYKVAE